MDKFYTISEIASLWSISAAAARRLFEREAGVLRVPHPGAPRKRKFVTLRIPTEVMERVYVTAIADAHIHGSENHGLETAVNQHM